MAKQLNLDPTQLPKGVGSGFVWDYKGHIITNFHVINKVAPPISRHHAVMSSSDIDYQVDTAQVTLTQPDGSTKTYTAKLTGSISPSCCVTRGADKSCAAVRRGP